MIDRPAGNFAGFPFSTTKAKRGSVLVTHRTRDQNSNKLPRRKRLAIDPEEIRHHEDRGFLHFTTADLKANPEGPRKRLERKFTRR
jgi:hypothetical protein